VTLAGITIEQPGAWSPSGPHPGDLLLAKVVTGVGRPAAVPLLVGIECPRLTAIMPVIGAAALWRGQLRVCGSIVVGVPR
jgi:hypothetical protein